MVGDLPTRDGWGVQLVAGVDEAGRGPLAGPVVAAAVIFAPEPRIDGLRDSKRMSAKVRSSVADEIKGHAISWGVGQASVDEIDRLNILEAAMLAMWRAVEVLDPAPSYALIDGNRCPALTTPAEAVVGGDNRVPAIAAASVLAKVARDQIMQEMDAEFPEYGFAQHKGYGTKAHLEALRQFGPSAIHRRSFAPVRRTVADLYNSDLG